MPNREDRDERPALEKDPCLLFRESVHSALELLDETSGRDGGATSHAELLRRLRDQRSFDLLALPLQERLQPDPFFQTHSVGGGAMYVTTTLRLAADPRQVLRAVLEQPWAWWRHGKVLGWKRQASGGVRFRLYPMWLRSPACVGIDLGPPAAGEETEPCGTTRTKTALAARFFGSFRGTGRYEILEVPGGAVFRSVFDGVRRAGFTRCMPLRTVLDLHVRAESGRLGFPFPGDTGFGGLRDHLRDRGPQGQTPVD